MVRALSAVAAALALAAPGIALADEGPGRYDNRFERAIERHYSRSLDVDAGWSFYYDASIRKCNRARGRKLAVCNTTVLVELRDAEDYVVESCTDSVAGYIDRRKRAHLTRVMPCGSDPR